MSGRFVRSSSFRHVFGTAGKSDQQYTNLSVSFNGDGNYLAGNGKFVAFAGVGGGGPVNVLSVEQTGRMALGQKKLTVHKAKVLDFQFNPFNDNLLATAGEDCYIKLSQIPDGGIKDDHINEALVTFEGHEKKITSLKWHPTANNILTSISADNTVKLWDAENGSEVASYDGFENTIFNCDYNRNGSQLAVISKDKKIRLYDPRKTDAITSIATHQGVKKSSVFYISKHGLLGSVGFTRSSMRQIIIYDPRNTDKPLATKDIDQAAGVFSSHYDHDTSLLFLAGKGDSSIRYFELTNEAPYVHFLSTFSDTQSQKGVAFLPKLTVDVGECEIASCLRLLRDKIIPVGFKVPRKSGLFQKDLFPDGYAGAPALEGKEWLTGKDEEPVLTSMKPGQQVRAKVEFSAKKSYAELEAELKKAQARIKELEAQLK